MKILIVSVGMLMLVATALPLIKNDAWWIRIFDFPRIQITVLAAAALVSYPVFVGEYDLRDTLFLAALAAATVYQGYMMFPYTFLARKQVKPSRAGQSDASFSLFFANVLMTNRDSERLRRIVREADPDIILTVETDEWWRDELKEFERTHPFVIQQPQDNTYGMLLYSRLKLSDAEVKFLVQDDIPSIHARVTLRSGQDVELRCLHPRPPFPTEDERSTERDVELILVGREIKDKDLPVVVLGDLNDVAWSHTNYMFQDISGLVDPRIGRGFFNTFHAKYPFIRFPLDHFFHSTHFKLIDFRRLPYTGSDHFPVFIALSYEPDADSEREKPRADASEEEEADEKIAKAG